MKAYEAGRRRMAISALPHLARLLGVSIEELFGEPARAGKRGPVPKLQQQMERIQRLPKSQQRFVRHDRHRASPAGSVKAAGG